MQDDLLNATTPTDLTTLPPAQRAALVLESTKAEAQLRELVSLSVDITEVKDKAGREQAHRAGMTLKNARVGIEKIGKAAREDAKNFSNAVIAEEKRLVGIVEGEESRIFGLRDGWDAAEAARKAELERIEQERVRVLHAKIEAIRNLPHACLQDDAAALAGTIEDLQALAPVTADFAEFVDAAVSARDTAIVLLQEMYVGAVAREAEAARLAAERAELEVLRAAQAERERQAAAEQAERDRVAAETKRQLDAQQAAIAAERKAQEDKSAQLEADRRAFEAHQSEQKAAAERAAAAPVAVDAPTIAEREGVAHINADWAAEPAPDEQWNAVAAASQEVSHTQLATDSLRSALREALLTLSTNEIRAIVDDELQAAEAA